MRKMSFLAAFALVSVGLCGQGLGFGAPINNGNAAKLPVPASSNTSGQFGLGGNPRAVMSWEDIRKKVYNKDMVKVSDVKGYPYVNKEFLPATIFYGQKIEKECFARLDGYNDEVEFIVDKSESSPIYTLLKSEKIKCVIGGLVISYESFFDDGKLKKNYVYKIYGGKKYTVFLRKRKMLRAKKSAQNSLQRSFPARFEQVEDFIITKYGANQNLVPKKNKKIIEALLGGDREAAKKYVKKKSLKLKEVKSLILLLSHLENDI